MMASSAPHVISTEILMRLRYYHIVTTLRKEVSFRIFNYCFLHGSSKSVLEILKDSGVPLGKKSNFNKDEIKRLSKNPPETLDISAINKICESLWEKDVNDPGETLRKLLKKMKDERNNLSHNEHNFSESELKTKLSEFNQILQDALDEAKNQYSGHKVDIDNLKVKIQEATSKVTEKIREKYDASDRDDMKKLKQEVEDCGDKLHEYIQEKAQKELCTIYEVLCRILPFEWLAQYTPTFPCSFSVSLKMDTDKDFHFGFSTNTAVTLDQNDLLQAKDQNGNDPKVIIISGDAGSGKSTLLSSIVENWYKGTHNMPCLSSFQILLYMQFRKHDHDNFNDFLCDLLQQSVHEFSFDLVKSFIMKSKCLILCDGYDEANTSSMKLFEEILELKIANKKMVVTTRPGSTTELTNITNKSRYFRLNVSLLGLRKEDMESLIKTLTAYLRNNEDERKKVVKRLDQVLSTLTPEMRQILKIPLWFNVFTLLQTECPNDMGDIHSVTALYIKMKKHTQKRMIEKLGIKDDKIALFDQVYREWSLRYYVQDKYELSQNEVNVFQGKCKELALDFDLIMSSHFTIKHTCKNLDIVKIYCYKHRSEQEFNAACTICDDIMEIYKNKPDEFEIMRTRNKRIVYNVLWSIIRRLNVDVSLNQSIVVTSKLKEINPFISGILYVKNRNLYLSLFDHIAPVDYNPIDSLIKHLIETNNDVCVRQKIMEKLKRLKGKWMEVRNTSTLHHLPQILAEVVPSRLHLVIDEDLDEVKILLPVLETVIKHNIEVEIDSVRNKIVPVESYISKVKFCKSFSGRLSVTGIRALPTTLGRLHATIDLDDLQELSSRLQVLNLSGLGLELVDHGTADPRSLSPLEISERCSFILHIRSEFDVNNPAFLERQTEVINAVWPLAATSKYERKLNLYSWKCGFSGDTVRSIFERLHIQSREIYLCLTSDAKEREEKELIELCKSKGLGDLSLSSF